MNPKRTTRPAGTNKALAAALNVTTRRVGQLLAAGMPDDPQAALEWRRQRESGDTSAEALRRERIVLVRAQAERVELENRIRSGDYIERGEVQASATRVYSVVRGEFMKFANDLPPRLEGLSAAEIGRILRDEVRLVLEHLSGDEGPILKPESQYPKS